MQGSVQSATRPSPGVMNSQMPSGTLPVKLLWSKKALVINVQLAIVSGMVPVRRLNDTENVSKFVHNPISDGSDPVNELVDPLMPNVSKFVHRPISEGNDPVRLLTPA